MDVNIILDKHKQDMLDSYPKYSDLTNLIFEYIEEMLLEDYDSLSSDKKRLRVLKSYLYDIVKKAFEENGHKYYLRRIMDVICDDNISKYICKNLNSEKEVFLDMMNGLKKSIIYWQGCEGVEDKKMQQLLNWVE